MMKKITIKDDFGINDVGNEDKVINIIKSIDIESKNLVLLNLRHCLIAYPATAKLIDEILSQLIKIEGDKKLCIRLDYDLPKQTLLNWLFLGSKYFNIELEKELQIEKLESIINKKMKESNISMEIAVLDRAGETKHEYIYE